MDGAHSSLVTASWESRGWVAGRNYLGRADESLLGRAHRSAPATFPSGPPSALPTPCRGHSSTSRQLSSNPLGAALSAEGRTAWSGVPPPGFPGFFAFVPP